MTENNTTHYNPHTMPVHSLVFGQNSTAEL